MTPSDAGSATSDGLAAELKLAVLRRDDARLALDYGLEDAAESHIAELVANYLPTILAALSPPSAPGDVGALAAELLRIAEHRRMGLLSTECATLRKAAAALSASAAEVEALRGALVEAREAFDDIASTAQGCAMTHGDPGGGLEMIYARATDWLAALTSPDGGRDG
jgi:multidrug efflux pump subunit AcrA (membrane-fusion protein)